MHKKDLDIVWLAFIFLKKMLAYDPFFSILSHIQSNMLVEHQKDLDIETLIFLKTSSIQKF